MLDALEGFVLLYAPVECLGGPGASVSHRVRHVGDERGVSINTHLIEARPEGLHEQSGRGIGIGGLIILEERRKEVLAAEEAVLRLGKEAGTYERCEQVTGGGCSQRG